MWRVQPYGKVWDSGVIPVSTEVIYHGFGCPSEKLSKLLVTTDVSTHDVTAKLFDRLMTHSENCNVNLQPTPFVPATGKWWLHLAHATTNHQAAARFISQSKSHKYL